MPGRDLPAPAVPASAYDEEYYRHGCAGADEWHPHSGASVAEMYPAFLRLAGFTPDDEVVDIGTGRGELVAIAAKLGARHAIGFDYSEDAIRLARETLHAQGVTDRAEVHVVDARRLPLEEESATLVTLLDVVEHLSDEELDHVLREARRILRPGGRVFIHTMPNRNLYEVAYRIHRQVVRPFGVRLPADPRNEYERLMHVNEQTPRSLRRRLRRLGFDSIDVHVGRWMYLDFLPHGQRRIYHWLRRVPGIREVVVADMHAVAHKPRA